MMMNVKKLPHRSHVTIAKNRIGWYMIWYNNYYKMEFLLIVFIFELVDEILLIIKKYSKSSDEFIIRLLDSTIDDINVYEFFFMISNRL